LRVVPVTREHVEVRLHGDADATLMPLIEELGLSVIQHHLTLLARPAPVIGVDLRRPAPASTAAWQAFFGVVPRFAHSASALRIAAASLDIELRTASPELQTIVHGASGGSTAAQVRAYVRAHLRDPLDADTVARALDLTARTLQRKLQAEHTSLREVTAAVRIEVARELLATTDRTVADISDAVGFAQPASFTRAFAAATGEPPADYRKRSRS
jgi:AraC-like DNA-binding protein